MFWPPRVGDRPRKNQLKPRIIVLRPGACTPSTTVSRPCVGCVAPSIGSADRRVTAKPKPLRRQQGCGRLSVWVLAHGISSTLAAN